jgi:saxitoxin biosynthesis operon SxtJ-like protein
MMPRDGGQSSVAVARRFGLTVGSAFLLLGALLAWRGKPAGAVSLAAVGALLALGGLARPVWLRPVYQAWMQVGQLLSKVTTPIILGVIYFLVITPFGLIRRLSGRDSLARSKRATSYWVGREGSPSDRSGMEHQF